MHSIPNLNNINSFSFLNKCNFLFIQFILFLSFQLITPHHVDPTHTPHSKRVAHNPSNIKNATRHTENHHTTRQETPRNGTASTHNSRVQKPCANIAHNTTHHIVSYVIRRRLGPNAGHDSSSCAP